MRVNEKTNKVDDENSRTVKNTKKRTYESGGVGGGDYCDAKNVIGLLNSSTSIDRDILSACLTLENRCGESIYSDIIYNLTRLKISPEKAKRHWSSIIGHMQAMNSKLGRNVGIHIAAGDYYANVKNYLKHPVLIEERSLMVKEDSAYRDDLTGLFNRRYFAQEMPAGVARFRRFGVPFSLLMLDLDHFKRFNDKYGHQAGDVALQIMGEVITQRIRIYDRATRYGGEEFAVILHQASRGDATAVAEKIRAAVEEQPIVYQGQNLGGLTVSIGIATCPIDALDVPSMVRRADQALYVAKRHRNSVVAFCDYNRSISRYVQERRLMA